MIVYVKTQGARIVKEGRHLVVKKGDGIYKTLFTYKLKQLLLFGNILVIALEGLSAGIQALRLNYYEFFSKFFNGTGDVYSPISLRNRD